MVASPWHDYFWTARARVSTGPAIECPPRVQRVDFDGGTVSLGGSTPLSAACLTGKAGLARLLLQRGARRRRLSWPTRSDGKYVEPSSCSVGLRGARHFSLGVAAPSRHRAPDHAFSGPAENCLVPHPPASSAELWLPSGRGSPIVIKPGASAPRVEHGAAELASVVADLHTVPTTPFVAATASAAS